MKFKFVIFSPSYSENNGGAVTLHHLCDLINKNGYQGYLYPGFDNVELNLNNYLTVLPKFLYKLIRQPFRRFKTSNRFNSPIIRNFPNGFDLNEVIVVYPEIVFGNPLGAKNVVRWFLHNPGFFSGKIFYGPDEIYFKYSAQYKDVKYLNSKMSNNNLYIFTYLKKYYNDLDFSNNRTGIAYCVRKGALSITPFDLKHAILIDGMKHKEISKIFKSVKFFISFDPHTAFSRFAALCGCISIVVPQVGIDEEVWQPDLEKRYGISYGFEKAKIDKALATVKELKKQLLIEEFNSIKVVKEFIGEVDSFFS
jgi:hypothetical protein